MRLIVPPLFFFFFRGATLRSPPRHGRPAMRVVVNEIGSPHLCLTFPPPAHAPPAAFSFPLGRISRLYMRLRRLSVG